MLGKLYRRYRERLGLTQREVADALYVDASVISRAETRTGYCRRYELFLIETSDSPRELAKRFRMEGLP